MSRKLTIKYYVEPDPAALARRAACHFVEMVTEAADAMDQGSAKAIREELGDVLLQVVLNSQVALDAGHFSIVDVIEGIDAKMRRRHPHVCGSEADKVASSQQVRANWDVIKAAEKGESGAQPKGLFAEAEKKTPATLQAQAIGKIAAKVR